MPGKNLVDQVWAAEKPPMPTEKVWILEEKYTGQSTLSKFKDVAEKMGKEADMMLVTMLDDIAWILNLRGNDISYNPVFFAYMIF